MDPLVERYTSSLSVDVKLARYDVIGSIAHAKMLGHCGILTVQESRSLVRGLEQMLKQIEQGQWKIDPAAEDVHTQVQQALEALVGPVARKIHTARSRNDQVCLDLRLYCRDAINALQQQIRNLQAALVGLADANQDVLIPGYTHLQRAQAISVAHHLLAYVEMLGRDVERLQDLRKRVDILPLGAGAIAGTSLPVDRAFVARELGFTRIAENSMDAVSSRDFALELIADLVQANLNLSRLAEDMILWASAEFALLQLDDAFATGSSLMPQKKNPDVLELVRGQAGVVLGYASGLFSVLKGLPLAYNRDLQWDKYCLFPAVELTQEALEVLARLFQACSIRREAAERLLQEDDLCATDLAEYLVERGVAFRDAHGMVGRIVAYAEQQGKHLRELSLKELQQFAPACAEDARAVLSARGSVQRKRSQGSTGPQQVRRSVARWKKRLQA
jgi:argininosuccinate lyase